MPNESAYESIIAAIAQVRREGGPIVDFCPLQTREKSLPNNNLVLWFTLCKKDENQQRILSLNFDRTREVQFPGAAYFRVCQPRIVQAIRGFWDDVNSSPNATVPIP
jgi:hypothetical protein